jgi:hypothetical protein
MVVPQLGILGADIQFFEILDRLVEVKDASSAGAWTAGSCRPG